MKVLTKIIILMNNSQTYNYIVNSNNDDDCRAEYPDVVGEAGLDSAKAFTVTYDAEGTYKDKDLDRVAK